MNSEEKPRILKPLRRTSKDALVFAEVLHADRVDRLGNPYSLYLKRVAIRAWHNAPKDEDMIYQVACLQSSLCHETYSQKQISPVDLRDEGFSESVIEAVQILTPARKESFNDYAYRVASSRNAPAISVLIATIEHEADPPHELDSPVNGEGESTASKVKFLLMLKSVLLDITSNT